MTDTRTQKMPTKDAHVICALVSHSMHCSRGLYQPNRPASIQSANTLRSDLDTSDARCKRETQRSKSQSTAEEPHLSIQTGPRFQIKPASTRTFIESPWQHTRLLNSDAR